MAWQPVSGEMSFVLHQTDFVLLHKGNVYRATEVLMGDQIRIVAAWGTLTLPAVLNFNFETFIRLDLSYHVTFVLSCPLSNGPLAIHNHLTLSTSFSIKFFCFVYLHLHLLVECLSLQSQPASRTPNASVNIFFSFLYFLVLYRFLPDTSELGVKHKERENPVTLS